MTKDDKSFSEFVRQCWLKDKGLHYGWHMTAICEHLEAVANGTAPRLLINLSPSHGRPHRRNKGEKE